MNKILFAICLVCFLTSCSNGIDNHDREINGIIRLEIEHMDNYNKIYNVTDDIKVKTIIDSLKQSKLEDAIETRGIITGSKGAILGDLNKPLENLEEYIKKCK